MDKARAIELLKAAETFLTKLKLDHQFDAMKTTVFFDGTDCDGYCLLDDVTALLDDIESEDEEPVEHGWLLAYDEETGTFGCVGEYRSKKRRYENGTCNFKKRVRPYALSAS